jgi:hypothetical protein
VYAVFAAYLYVPYPDRFGVEGLAIGFNAVAGAVGCFVLSRRWVPSFAGSVFAGALYGFGPFVLWACSYHYAVGTLVGLVPWLFCPAAYVPRKAYWPLISRALSVLPFAAIAGFFVLTRYVHFYPMPITVRATGWTLYGMTEPLVALAHGGVPLGLYHVGLVTALMGVLMMFMAGRLGGMVICAVAVVLSLSKSFWGISPAAWLSIASVCGAVAAGMGMDGLIRAGRKDCKWILSVAVLAVGLYFEPVFSRAGWYGWPAETLTDWLRLAAAGAAAVVLAAAWLRLRTHGLRMAVLCAAMGADIFFSAGAVVQKVL